jgi:hypothetical protein
MIVKPQLAFSEINIADFDALAIPGGFEKAGLYVDAYNPLFLELICKFNDANKIIASIITDYKLHTNKKHKEKFLYAFFIFNHLYIKYLMRKL